MIGSVGLSLNWKIFYIPYSITILKKNFFSNISQQPNFTTTHILSNGVLFDSQLTMQASLLHKTTQCAYSLLTFLSKLIPNWRRFFPFIILNLAKIARIAWYFESAKVAVQFGDSWGL